MTTYRNVKCGNCKYSFTEGYKIDDGPKVKLGYPLIKCPKCGRLNKTGLVPWSKFSLGDKISFWLKTVAYSVIVGGLTFLLIVLVFCKIFGFDKFQDSSSNLILIFTIGAILGNIIMINGSKHKISLIEEVMKSPEYQSYLK